MKKIFLVSLFVILGIMLTGCGIQEERENIVANASVGSLKFYVPSDYQYRPDLRGYIYSEQEKKVYMKGDYDNDPDHVIALVVYTSNIGKGAKTYTDEINNNFTDADVKYSIKSSNKIVEIYARENYVIGNNVNYAYILDKAGYIYVVNIKGPKDKADEISKVVQEVYASLEFN